MRALDSFHSRLALVATTHKRPSVRIVTALLLILWTLGLFALRRTLKFFSAAALLFRKPLPDNPEDPYSRVRCPKGPRLPHRSAAGSVGEAQRGEIRSRDF